MPNSTDPVIHPPTAADQIPSVSPPVEPGPLGPTSRGDRIGSIDTLRGVALLGIFVMNIPFFALSGTSFFNPPADGGFEGANYAMWLVSHALFDMKMMAIFSMLFGAGVVLMAERIEAKGGKPAAVHYRRMLWLLAIGLVHAYVIWFGDILVTYALMGMPIPSGSRAGRASVRCSIPPRIRLPARPMLPSAGSSIASWPTRPTPS